MIKYVHVHAIFPGSPVVAQPESGSSMKLISNSSSSVSNTRTTNSFFRPVSPGRLHALF